MNTHRPTTYPLFATNGNVPVTDDSYSRTQFLGISRKISDQIKTIPIRNSHENLWLTAVHSPLLFAASVVACWESNVVPVLTADLQPDTLADLSGQLTGVLCDEPADIDGLPVVRLSKDHSDMFTAACGQTPGSDPATKNSASTAPLMPPTFNADDLAMVLFTSGSSGKKKRVDKPFFSLFEEVDNLERMFGGAVTGLSRRTTVSHFHIYGFLFNILWPLHAGHVLGQRTTFYWEQILHHGNDGACIVSSPAHLRVLCSMVPSHPFNWQKSIIFSSGGPLNRRVALDIFQATGNAPIEIFGSTETGGIGLRQQQSEKTLPFTPFPGVSTRRNDIDGLEVMSPWIPHAGQWIETGDRISFSQTDKGAFFPNGRYDTVVKIAGKRISLAEMESALRQMPEIEDVRVFQYTTEERDARGVLAAVLIPAPGPIPEGPMKQQLVKLIKARMRRRFDLVALPRYWRFVRDFPRNTEGKVPLEMLIETVQNGR